MKKIYFSMTSVAVCALLLTGCKQNVADKIAPVVVKTMKVAPVTINDGQEFSGTVEESSASTLSFPVAGTVKRVRVNEGQRVSRGELIATLDEATLQSSYDAAAAALTQAEDAYNRLKQLHDNSSLPEVQWVEVQSKLRQAQSMEEISRKNLADGKLYAPFSGVISEKNVEVGQNVVPGMPVVKLLTVSQVKICIAVPEKEMSDMTIGSAVNVRVSALDGRTFTGKIMEKGIAANKLSRSYNVKATVDNQSGELMPGMICDVTTGIDCASSAIVLPSEVVQIDHDNTHFVWLNNAGKAHKQTIQTGNLTTGGVVVTSGLKDGDEVIVEGRQKVSENTEITTENLQQ
jgi:RND family efflux transporter MFP subunit